MPRKPTKDGERRIYFVVTRAEYDLMLAEGNRTREDFTKIIRRMLQPIINPKAPDAAH